MSTTYNPYSSVKSIYDLKKQWEDAYNAGNSTAANSAAQNAKKFYEDLKKNGYGEVADKLSKVNYAGAKSIHDEYATANKTAIRPYFETLAKANNMDSNEINKLIKYNNDTGRVSFAGTDIGKPDAAFDGTSYWNKDYLKGVWDSYMKDSKANDYNGVKGNAVYSDRTDSATKKNDKLHTELNEYNSDFKDKFGVYWGAATTPYAESSDLEAAQKYVMPYYDTLGNSAAYGAVASSASSNSGNVDSFAAANAVRQRNAQIAQGQKLAYELGLGAYQGRIDNIKNALDTLGYHRESLTNQMNTNISTDREIAQQAFDNAEAQRLNEHNMSEAKKNNKVTREETLSSITGTQSPYVQYVGTLYDEEGNFLPNLDNVNVQALINEVDKKLKAATTQEEKDNLTATRNMLLQARAHKVYSDLGKYGQYASSLEMPAATPTAAYQLAQSQMNSDLLSSMAEQEAKQYQTDMEARLKREEMQNDYNIAAMKNESEKEGENYELNYGAKITPIANTLDKSASDEAERKVLKGYESRGINNLAARFINELYDIAQANNTDETPESEKDVLSIKTILNTIANRSDAYGLTIDDVYSILDYLDLGTYKSYFEQIDAPGRSDEPGVKLVENI